MARTSGPLLSFDARATVGKTVVYSNWKGIPYARRWVQPANPNTTDQQAVRNVFKWLQSVWSYMPAVVQEAWNAYAAGQPLTGRNAFAKFNVAPLQGQADLTNFIMSPAARSGPVAAGATFTGGNDQVTIDVVAPSLPSGWTIVEAVGAAIRQQDPASGTFYQISAGTDATSTYQIILTGLASAQTYVCGAWFKYMKPDGSFAYGPAIQGTALTT
jgi:hypothetical protein